MNLYGDSRSGNCYKIKLLASFLEIRMVWIDVDVLVGETRREDFLGRNPNGKIPLLELDDGRCLSESNAILHYLAEGSGWLPTDRYEHAKVLQWQNFEQYSHEPYIAVARFIAVYQGLPEERRSEYESKHEGGYKALSIMEHQLDATPFLTGELPTIADISLYAYTHVAHEGGFELDSFPAIRAWLKRLEALPGYVPMSGSGP
ncbi:glutathione S-transferase family protein [Halomonas binhaiensis]|uniref:Glutathione S-transferase family protein n=1 Tax=Halomonas binhaiensis TaxID=2562282 RepID=A0A5C1NIY9_9GAMM|nr:glutathione S-transferase family protein [Halomonas binhaiensis]QEM83274.1 glutathione S-transferase family protein [Halomonas binhaiensis]